MDVVDTGEGQSQESVPTYRVVIVDRDLGFGTALAQVISTAGLTVIGTHRQARAALGSAAGDLLVIDPEGQRPSDVATLSQRHPRMRRVIVTADTRYAPVIDHLRCGAVGLIGKGESPETMAALLVQASRGGAALCSTASQHLLRALQRSVTATPHQARLTSREEEVVALLADGYGYDSIAANLGIGLGTVQSHVKNLYRKLGVRTKSEAVAVALRAGLVPPAPGPVPN